MQPSNAASLEASHVATNQDGRASSLVRVGSYSGDFSITATVKGKSVTFHLEAEAAPTQISADSGSAAGAPAADRHTAVGGAHSGPDGQSFAGASA